MNHNQEASSSLAIYINRYSGVEVSHGSFISQVCNWHLCVAQRTVLKSDFLFSATAQNFVREHFWNGTVCSWTWLARLRESLRWLGIILEFHWKFCISLTFNLKWANWNFSTWPLIPLCDKNMRQSDRDFIEFLSRQIVSMAFSCLPWIRLFSGYKGLPSYTL